MAVDLNTMGVNIQTVLSGVPGILKVYDIEPQNLEILPAATLYFDGFDGSEETIGRISYDWRWTIRIYIPLPTSDVETPQKQLRTITTDTLIQLRANLQLNGSCLYSKATSGEIMTILNQTNPMMVSEINLTATTQENR